jgi:hypothetical protein
VGSTIDISPLLRFHFWEKVYYKCVDTDFPSESREKVGHIVGISEHCGHAMTWKILTTDTKRIIFRSLVRPVSPSDANLRADMFAGEDDSPSNFSEPIIKSRLDGHGSKHDSVATFDPSLFDPDALIGRTFLLDEQDENGHRLRARVVKLVEDHERRVENNPARLKFVLSMNGDKSEEVITYNELMEYLSRDEEGDHVWKFSRIVAHEGPLKSTDRTYKGSKYNVMIEWENGETTTEPLRLIAADNPVMCAIYARHNNLLDLPGWKRFKGLAKRQRKHELMVAKAKLQSNHSAPKYKYGYEIPRDYAHAVRIDERNGNRLWQDAVDLEFKQVHEYNTFKDLGHQSMTTVPAGYKKIRVHLVFDVKHDG